MLLERHVAPRGSWSWGAGFVAGAVVATAGCVAVAALVLAAPPLARTPDAQLVRRVEVRMPAGSRALANKGTAIWLCEESTTK